MELLPNITRYLLFSERKEHYKHALQKAGETLTQLKRFSAEAKQSVQMQQRETITLASAEATRRYKSLPFAEKISCLIIDEELEAIESGYTAMQKLPAGMPAEEVEPYQQSRIKRDLFNQTLKRILNVLKYNYLPEFNRLQMQDLNREHTRLQPPLGFNSLDQAGVLPDKVQTGRQANIFGILGTHFAEQKKRQGSSRRGQRNQAAGGLENSILLASSARASNEPAQPSMQKTKSFTH